MQVTNKTNKFYNTLKLIKEQQAVSIDALQTTVTNHSKQLQG